jgi:hypothetical protein
MSKLRWPGDGRGVETQMGIQRFRRACSLEFNRMIHVSNGQIFERGSEVGGCWRVRDYLLLSSTG